MNRKRRNLLRQALTLAITTLATSAAQAGDWHWSFGLGYGGEGISTTATTTQPVVNRADGPLMVELSIDKFVADNFMLSFSHSRGISAAPFSSGEGFTGISGVYYFLGAPSVIPPESKDTTTLAVARWTPFFGLSTGYANASISRDASAVPTAAGSGVYLGFRAGADYPTGPGRGWRPELVYASTSFMQSLSKSETPPPVLEHFSLQFSWYFGF